MWAKVKAVGTKCVACFKQTWSWMKKAGSLVNSGLEYMCSKLSIKGVLFALIVASSCWLVMVIPGSSTSSTAPVKGVGMKKLEESLATVLHERNVKNIIVPLQNRDEKKALTMLFAGLKVSVEAMNKTAHLIGTYFQGEDKGFACVYGSEEPQKFKELIVNQLNKSENAAIVIDVTNGFNSRNKDFLEEGFDDSTPVLSYNKQTLSTSQVVFILLSTFTNVSREEQKTFDLAQTILSGNSQKTSVIEDKIKLVIRNKLVREWTARFYQRIREVVFFPK